jgi:hypothetical protein
MSATHVTSRLGIEGLEDRTCPSRTFIPVEQFYLADARDPGGTAVSDYHNDYAVARSGLGAGGYELATGNPDT